MERRRRSQRSKKKKKVGHWSKMSVRGYSGYLGLSKKHMLIEDLPIKFHGNILDVGTGDALNVLKIKRLYPDTIVFAIEAGSPVAPDNDSLRISICKERLGPYFEQVSVQNVSEKYYNFFDYVTSFKLMFNYDETQRISYIEAVVKCLKKDGIFLITTVEYERTDPKSPLYIIDDLRKYFKNVIITPICKNSILDNKEYARYDVIVCSVLKCI